MLDYILIAFLILCGIALIIVEIIFIPGTTVVGMLGFLIGAYGIYLTYNQYGSNSGHIVLTVSLFSALTAIILSFKSGAWNKFANTGSMDTPVNQGLTAHLKIGQEGNSVSSLKPIGKAEFNNLEFEVTSLGNFVEENQAVRIVKLERNKIFVEPIKQVK